MTKLKPNKERAKNAIVLLWIALAASVLLLVFEAYTYKILLDVDAGMYLDPESAEMYLIIAGATSVVYTLVFLLSAIFFIMWFRRAYFNLHLLVSNKLRYSEGWAAGAWFIPIFNLFGPYNIATDLHTYTETMLLDKGLIEPDPKRIQIKNAWWALWIIGSILGNIGSRMDDKMVNEGAVIAIIASVITIGAGLLAIKMIKNYSQMEELLPQLEDVSNTPDIVGDSDILDAGM
ncbi:MAG: DUF4328 domain-containing protein [Crocinitomicaceae bacterium]|nr:DUF4328 domain-containing protein [Crocinitomicaceae bacterium]